MTQRPIWGFGARLKHWARVIRREITAVYFVARDPLLPWYGKALAAFVAAYALSPFDLIPDFIPIIGHFDDMILVPLGILAVVKMVPPPIMAELRAEAWMAIGKPTSRIAPASLFGLARARDIRGRRDLSSLREPRSE